MDSEAGIIELVLGTEFSNYDERAIIKLGLQTGAGSSHGMSVQAPIRFVILHSVYDSLGRLATARERLVLRNYTFNEGTVEVMNTL